MASSIYSNPLQRSQVSQPDTTNTSEEPGNLEAHSSSKKRKGGSLMWKHNTKEKRTLVDGSTTIVGICHYCQEELKADTTKNGTSAMRHHHYKVCKASPLYEGHGVKGQTILTNDSMGGGALVSHNFNQKRCELKVIEFVIVDEMPFRVVEGKGFVSMMHEAQPRFKVPNRKKIAVGVYDLFLLEKAKIKSAIHEKRVSITTDTWTSVQNINYMVVTGHFMDCNWKLHKRILSFTKIISHFGDNIGKKLEMCLNDWGIEKVFSITVDNASSNQTAINFMKKRFKGLKSLMLEGNYLHLRCACHILNIIVTEGLIELKSSIKGIRNAVVWIHSSPSRLQTFREFAILEKFNSMSTVPMDVKTRWNATYKMLKAALKFRRVFDRLAEDCHPYVQFFQEKVKNKNGEMVKTRVGPPVEEDWVKTEAFVHFLGYFYECTLVLSATKGCTSHMLLLPSIMTVQYELETQAQDFTDMPLNRVAFSMLTKFDKYWDLDKVNPLVFIANVLDPRSKFQMIKVCLSELGWNETQVATLVMKITNDLQCLWLEYKGDRSVSVTDGGGSARMQVDGEATSVDGASKSGFYSKIKTMVKNQNKREKQNHLSNEVDKYLTDSIEEEDDDDEFNILEWWKGSETRYPIISKIAKDILAIPSSTVASESAFSLGKRIVDPFRSNLSPKMVEALVCTNDWLRADLFSLYRDPTDDELELYREIEEIEASAQTTQASFIAPTPPPPSASTAS